MKVRDKITALIVFATILMLILDSETSINGCREGLDLCISSVVPSLFPFLVLSPILINTLRLQLPKWLHSALKLPENSDALLIAGYLGGYPVGAQCIAAAANNGQLSIQNAHRLLAFCCNCGPGFIFGICGTIFNFKWAALGLWLCHTSAAFLIGMILPEKEGTSGSWAVTKISAIEAFTKAIKAMAHICGWVILTRCILAILQKWVLWRLGEAVQALIIGSLELTNGCLYLAQISNESLRFIICEALLSFGGLCVAMQTASVTHNIGLGLYLPGKLGQMLLSSLLAWELWEIKTGKFLQALVLLGIIGILLTGTKLFLGKRENFSRNLQPTGV